jgi:hypothetical protein
MLKLINPHCKISSIPWFRNCVDHLGWVSDSVSWVSDSVSWVSDSVSWVSDSVIHPIHVVNEPINRLTNQTHRSIAVHCG